MPLYNKDGERFGCVIDYLVRDSNVQVTPELLVFIDEFIYAVRDAICSCDVHPKMVLHEPYRTIMTKVTDYFFEQEEE